MVDTKKLEALLERDGIVFLTYASFITQSLVVGMTEALEKESEISDLSMKESHNMLTIFIELSQNMMNYTKKVEIDGEEFDPKGMIIVGKKDGSYYILSKNVISIEDKDRVEPKLKTILDTDLDGIKKLYKEARRSGKDKHGKGSGGIGFYEIAKRCTAIEYDFMPISDDRFSFKFKAIL